MTVLIKHTHTVGTPNQKETTHTRQTLNTHTQRHRKHTPLPLGKIKHRSCHKQRVHIHTHTFVKASYGPHTNSEGVSELRNKTAVSWSALENHSAKPDLTSPRETRCHTHIKTRTHTSKHTRRAYQHAPRRPRALKLTRRIIYNDSTSEERVLHALSFPQTHIHTPETFLKKKTAYCVQTDKMKSSKQF